MRNRVGETSVHKATGQIMTIIKYRSVKSIDIQFEDGSIITDKNYSAFKKGSVKHSNLRKHAIGEKSIHKATGQEMTLLAYRSSKDVDILFEDGSILRNRPYYNFKVGTVRHPSISISRCGYYLGDLRVGETSVSTAGQSMKIIVYRNAQDLDVQFEDGMIVKHRTYRRFKDGQIANPNLRQVHPKQVKELVGEQKLNKYGELMTIISRHGDRIDVQFENGKIRRNVGRAQFLNGSLASESRLDKLEVIRQERLGTKVKALNGLEMTAIGYDGFNHVTVQFEDGEIVKDIRWQSFISGVVGHPSIRRRARKMIKHKRIGESNIAHCGMKMQIIEYRNSDDIDVQFEDGNIIQHRTYTNFKKGNIANKHKNIQKNAEEM